MPASNGGTPLPLSLALYPVAGTTGEPIFYFFDTSNFNDPNVGSFYFWKVEPIIEGRTPTCNRQIITYRDLGVVSITCILSGYDQLKQQTVMVQQTVTLGTVAATGKICSTTPAQLSLDLTAMNLQFNVVRAAGAGPLSIIKVRLEGMVETT